LYSSVLVPKVPRETVRTAGPIQSCVFRLARFGCQRAESRRRGLEDTSSQRGGQPRPVVPDCRKEAFRRGRRNYTGEPGGQGEPVVNGDRCSLVWCSGAGSSSGRRPR
jgi:hypothetical protein